MDQSKIICGFLYDPNNINKNKKVIECSRRSHLAAFSHFYLVCVFDTYVHFTCKSLWHCDMHVHKIYQNQKHYVNH